MVSEFVSEILNTSKIDVINVLEEKEGMEIFGQVGKNGCIIISMKPKAKFKFKISGLKYNKRRKTSNNFLQIPNGGKYFMIRS